MNKKDHQRRGVVFVGSRGIPATYGGNETFVEEVSKRLLKKGFKVFVTCESNRFYTDNYNGIVRIHTPSVESKIATIPIINDLISTITIYLIYKMVSDVDIFVYVTPDGAIPSILPKILGKYVLINTDGIEWKRPLKRKKFWPFYLKILCPLMVFEEWLSERLSTKVSDIVIADSLAIKDHLIRTHRARRVTFIPYGARKLISAKITKEEENRILEEYGLKSGDYYLTVARIVAENNIHMEVEGFKKAKTNKKLVIVGNFNEKDPYTKYLFKLKGNNEKIIFLNPIYDKEVLGVLRKNCFAYIHAYEVGGTNPSLLEQMLFRRPILAYDVPFNKEVLQEGGIYFKDAEDLSNKIEMLERGEFDLRLIKKTQIKRIRRQYNWEKVAREYERVFKSLFEEG